LQTRRAAMARRVIGEAQSLGDPRNYEEGTSGYGVFSGQEK